MNNPIPDLNRVIMDISGSGSFSNNQMYEEVQKLYENYNTDLEYQRTIHALIDDLKGSATSTLEKNVNHKKKQQDIQEYYHQQYEQQIFIIKLLIFFAFIAMMGCLLFNYGWISVYLLTFYLGFVFSVGFVVVFYYLWDLSLRDTSIFDEYNFETYLPPKSDKIDRTSWRLEQLYDNKILC